MTSKWEPEVLIIDDFLPETVFKVVSNEIEMNRDYFYDQEISKIDGKAWASFKRWYPPNGTIIPNIIDTNLFSERVQELVKEYVDGFWKLFYNKIAWGFEVQVTSYNKNKDSVYNWHVDHMPGIDNKVMKFMGVRILNYIFYLNDVDEGGELEIGDHTSGVVFNRQMECDVIKSFAPKKNRLVVIPSWYVHRVKPVLSDQERLTINGHVYMESFEDIKKRMKILYEYN